MVPSVPRRALPIHWILVTAVVTSGVRIRSQSRSGVEEDLTLEQSITEGEDAWHVTQGSSRTAELETLGLRGLDVRRHETEPDGLEKKGRVAVLLVGLQDRFLAASKMKQAIIPTLQDGWDVDVFLRLVKAGAGDNMFWVPLANWTTAKSPYLIDTMRRQLEAAGARLASGELLDKQEPVEQDLTRRRTRPQRLSGYTPTSDDLVGRVGKNVLRRLYSLQALMREAVSMSKHRGQAYDWVLVTRDDAEWLSPFNLSSFSGAGQDVVHSLPCWSWGGINDKDMLFSGGAAEKVIANVYDDYFRNPDDHALDSLNGEEFWLKDLRLHQVENRWAKWEKIPATIATYIKTPEGELLCRKRKTCARNFSIETVPYCPIKLMMRTGNQEDMMRVARQGGRWPAHLPPPG